MPNKTIPLSEFPFSSLEVRAFRSDSDIWNDFIQFLVISRARPEGFPNINYAGELVLREVAKGESPAAPTFSIHRQHGQALMDQLWQIGIRPSDIGTPGHLAATQAHLADFRVIVAKQLGVKLK